MRRALALTFVVLLAAAGCGQHRGASPTGSPRPTASASRGDPDLPRDPVRPRYLTLRGTLRISHGCRLLSSDAGSYALYGGGTGKLVDGQLVAVRGRVASGPDTCRPATPFTVVAIVS